jgi:hypothetical protein
LETDETEAEENESDGGESGILLPSVPNRGKDSPQDMAASHALSAIATEANDQDVDVQDLGEVVPLTKATLDNIPPTEKLPMLPSKG